MIRCDVWRVQVAGGSLNMHLRRHLEISRLVPTTPDCIATTSVPILQPTDPAQGSGYAYARWLQRYRKLALWAVFFTLVAVPFIAYFQTDDFTRLMLAIGTIAGLAIFAYFGRWLWNSFQMLEKGMTIKTGPGEYIILFLIAGGIPLSILLLILLITALVGLIPLTVSLAFPAFATGFAFIPWYVYPYTGVRKKARMPAMFDKGGHSP
jgi:hypothetical protein